jgi:hypothetical protein
VRRFISFGAVASIHSTLVQLEVMESK